MDKVERPSTMRAIWARAPSPASGMAANSSWEYGGVEVALLDTAGMIVAVNAAWNSFCDANGGDPDRVGIGCSYLDACNAAAGDPDADRVSAAILRALQGDLPAPIAIEVPCHSPERARWYDVLISSRFGDDARCVGATVTLSLAASGGPPPASGDRPPAPTEARPAPAGGIQPPAIPEDPWFSERLGEHFARAVLELAPVGIVVTDDKGLIVRSNALAEELFGYGPHQLLGRHLQRLFPQLVRTEQGPGPADPRGPFRFADTVAGPSVGRRADGSFLRARVRLGPVATSRGTGTIVLVTPVDPADSPPESGLPR